MSRIRPRSWKAESMTTRVPPSTGSKASVTSNGALLERPFVAARRGGSCSVTTASFSTPRPMTRTRARRTEPTPCGGGVVHHSSTCAGYQRPVSVTSVRTSNTSSIGRLISMVWRVTTSLPLARAEDPIGRGVEPRPAHYQEEWGDGEHSQIGTSEQSRDPNFDAERQQQGAETDESEPHAHQDES